MTSYFENFLLSLLHIVEYFTTNGILIWFSTCAFKSLYVFKNLWFEHTGSRDAHLRQPCYCAPRAWRSPRRLSVLYCFLVPLREGICLVFSKQVLLSVISVWLRNQMSIANLTGRRSSPPSCSLKRPSVHALKLSCPLSPQDLCSCCCHRLFTPVTLIPKISAELCFLNPSVGSLLWRSSHMWFLWIWKTKGTQILLV